MSKLLNVKQWGIIIGLFWLCFLANISPMLASDPQRVLRSDFRNLETRIRTLEAEVRRLQGSTSLSSLSPNSPNSYPQIVDGELIGRSDPLMERFATLLIELKEQVKQLENRVTQLENKE